MNFGNTLLISTKKEKKKSSLGIWDYIEFINSGIQNFHSHPFSPPWLPVL
jgi:hypothetical protein